LLPACDELLSSSYEKSQRMVPPWSLRPPPSRPAARAAPGVASQFCVKAL